MKIGKPCLVVAAVTALMTATPQSARAQVPLVTFDELGNITIGGVPGPLGFLLIEGFSGLTTLAYLLPFPVTPGDIVLLEAAGPSPSPPSDVLRFFGGFLWVFSEATLGEPPEPGVLADGPLPGLFPPAVGSTIILDEMGVEAGPNGLFGYVAAPGTPGFGLAPGLNPTYNFFSDLGPTAVPEPGSLLLTFTGGGVLALALRRRTRGNRAAA